MGFIYLIRNTINGKCYIGQTNDVNRRMREYQSLSQKGDGFIIHSAIRKYGWDAFDVVILHNNILPELLDIFEIEAIKKYDTLVPNGYNLTSGGGGAKDLPADVRDRMSKKSRGENNPMFGKKRPDLVEYNRNRKGQKREPFSESHRRAIGDAHRGKKDRQKQDRSYATYGNIEKGKTLRL